MDAEDDEDEDEGDDDRDRDMRWFWGRREEEEEDDPDAASEEPILSGMRARACAQSSSVSAPSIYDLSNPLALPPDVYKDQREHLLANAHRAFHDDGDATAFITPPGTERVLNPNVSWAWPPEFGPGNLFQQLRDDSLASIRIQHNNVYYPFRDRPEYQLVEWLESCNLSQADKDRFLKLEIVSRLQSMSIVVSETEQSHNRFSVLT